MRRKKLILYGIIYLVVVITCTVLICLMIRKLGTMVDVKIEVKPHAYWHGNMDHNGIYIMPVTRKP